MSRPSPLHTELHRHLDASIRLSTLLELTQAKGLEGQSTSLTAFREKIILNRPMSDLSTVLAKFLVFQQVLDHPDVLQRVAFEALEDCYNEGIKRVELRFSPAFVCELSHLKWEDVLEGFHRGIQQGMKQYKDVRAGLICIASRDYGPDEASRTVEFFLKNQDRLIGLDLAGNEDAFPCHLFEKAFRPAIDHGAKITVHAGEASGPENVWEAIELLGARRIGHGIHSVQDPQLMAELRKREICLEVCPTSNWITQSVPTLREHPLPQILKSGVPVCINTDDPGIFGVTLPGEAEICRKEMGLTEMDLETCARHAQKSSFLEI